MDVELQKYLVLIAPAVAFFLVLSGRQARISAIARENVKHILESKRSATRENADEERVNNLIKQNATLLIRYHLIQGGLIVLCAGLLTAGLVVFREYFKGTGALFYIGAAAMVAGTIVTLTEILTGADTLKYEMDFAKWYPYAGKEQIEAVPKMRRCALFWAWKRSKASFNMAKSKLST